MKKRAEKIKMIVCDVDNTIIPSGYDAMSRRTAGVFKKAMEKGIRVVLNTGRHYTFLQESLFDDLPLDLIGTINGACVVKRDGTIIESHQMSETNMNTIKTSKKVIYKEIRDYVMISVAMISYGIGWTVFMLPNSIPTGGVPGVSSVLYWGTQLPVQFSYFTINFILLLIALKILGWKFCTKTIYAVTLLTLLIQLFQSFTEGQHLLANDPFMASIIGGVFMGSGVGIGLAFNGSTGGTDIIAAIINKYRDISLGRVIMMVDLIIITSSYVVLHDWERIIYGYVALIVSSLCVDQVVNSMRRSVQFFIISDKYKEIGERINHDPHRGVTVVNAQGFYSGNEVKMLFVLAKKNESHKIFQLINEIDPNAFVSQSAVIGVYGEGFDQFKVRTKRYQN